MADTEFVNVDLDCFEDLDPFAGELTDPVAILIQDVFHILIETPGSNIDVPTRGIGIEDRLSGPFDQTLAAHIDAELEKDDRVDVSKTAITDRGAGVFDVHIDIQYDDQALGLDFVKDATGFRPVGA